MLRVWGVVCALVVAGCVDSNALECGDLTCPKGYHCLEDNRCVSDDALHACEGKSEGDGCMADGLSGVCEADTCVTVVCGNGRVDPGEICDDGNLESGDGCNPTCRSDETCGNGFIDPGEGCDCGDGAAGHDNQACTEPNSAEASASCRPDCSPHGCGDGVVENAEQCEPDGDMMVTCAELGFYSGTPTCNAVCRATETGCTGTCGDGVVDLAFEESCDGAPPPGQSCLDYGFDRGVLGCSSSLCRPQFDDCTQLGWVQFGLESRQFTTLSGTSDTDVWAGGPAGAVLHWDGTTWNDASVTGILHPITGLFAAGPDDVWAVDDGASFGEIFHRTGTTWTSVHTTSSSLHAVAASGNTVIAVGSNGLVSMTTGSDWTDVSVAPGILEAVAVISETEAYAAGGNGRDSYLTHWTGGTWTPVTVPNIGNIHAIWARSSDDIYIGGSTLVHWNGTTWDAISLGIGASITAISGTATDVFVAYAVPDGTIAQFDGSAWALHDIGSTQAMAALYAAPGGKAFAAGLRLMRYVGSGFTTSKVPSPITIRAVGGVPGEHPIAVGDGGFAMQFDGALWRRVPSQLTEIPRAISRDVLVGDNGALARFDGTRITTYPSNVTESLSAVWTATTGDAWAVGQRGKIIHFNGSTTSTEGSGTTTQLNGVLGFSPTDVFAVGDGGVILHSNGIAWSDFAGPTGWTKNFTGIAGTANNDFVVFSENGTAWRYTGTWNQLQSPFGSAAFGTPATVASDQIYVTQGDAVIKLDPAAGTFGFAGAAVSLHGAGTDGTNVFVAGDTFGLYRVDLAQSAVTAQLQSFAGGGLYRKLYAVAPDDVWGALSSRGMGHFDGFVWSTVTAPVLGFDVSGTGPDDVWTLNTKDQKSAHWNGSSWTAESLTTGNLTTLSATTNEVYAAGNVGALAHRDTSWHADTTGAINVQLNDVFALAPSDAVAVGENFTVVEWNGASWSVDSAPTGQTAPLFGVWGAGTDLFVAGQAVIGHRAAGTWTVTDTPGRKLEALYGTAPDDVFAAGSSGTLMYFDGTTWSQIDSRSVSELTDLAGAGKTIFIAAPDATGSVRGLRRDVAW
jgi:cysteine-rich repeat protein